MFDLNYNDVGFIPAVAVFKSKASTEEIKKTQEEVKELSKDVEEQSTAVSKNSDAIATNAAAIANETAAREEAVEGLNDKIDEIPTFETEVVDELPAEGKPGTIYLVKDEGKDTYSEYLYAGGAWEKLGSDVNLSDYATKEELAEAVAPLAVKSAVDTLIDQEATAREELAANVYTKAEADAKFVTEVPDVSGFATKEEVEAVDTKVEAIVIPDVSDFATKEEVEAVDEKIDAIVIPDVSNLATKEEVEAVDAKVDAIVIPDVSGFATKEELNAAVAPLAVKSAVDELINGEAATREQEISELRSEIVALPKFKILIVDQLPAEGDGATLYLVATGDESGNEYTEYVFVDGKWEEIGTQSLDLSEYAKTEYVDAEIATISGIVETLNLEFDSVDEKLAGLAAANLAQDTVIATKANAEDVYSKVEADGLLAGKTNVADYESLRADFTAVKKLVGGMGAAVSWSANSKSDVTDLLGNGGGTVNLTVDITEEDGMFQYTTPTFGSPTKTLNLRNHNIITSGRNNACMFLLRADQELTITGGNITNTNTSGSSAGESTLRNPVFIAKGNSVLNLSLGSSKTATTLSMDPVVVCQENATINIKSGNYITSDVCLIYCMNGLINITGGSFRSTANPAGFLINCLDASYQAGTANIVISSTSKTSGPKFYDFNPADCGSEGEHTSFVAEDCEVKESTEIIDEVEHTVYIVVKSA